MLRLMETSPWCQRSPSTKLEVVLLYWKSARGSNQKGILYLCTSSVSMAVVFVSAVAQNDFLCIITQVS